MKTYKINFITTDNGAEYSGLYYLKEFNKQIEIYYCDPGKPGPKGQVEWFNKKLRNSSKRRCNHTQNNT